MAKKILVADDKNKFTDDEYRAIVSGLFGNLCESPVAVPLGGT